MNTAIKCYNTKCKFNHSCWCFPTEQITIGTDGSCLSYEEIDIYKEVEGFSREDLGR